MSALLAVEHVSKRFGGVQAVHNLSFSMAEGSILGLIGPNGAGKSTVFNLIDGVIAPDEGQIRFRGADITAQPPYRIARLGLARTHQIVQPFTTLSVLENCTVGACFGRENLRLEHGIEAAREALLQVAWTTAPRCSPRSSPSLARSDWNSPARSPPGRRCCCLTKSSQD